ncbi:MAG TPA: hypothetical protein DCS63_04660 [Elusimicrobia bacterium]|nr:hypothetical protein [Elusimicrobiota bacterium]
MNGEKIHIVLIEDEPVSAKITLRMLKEAGLDSAVTVRDTLEAGLKGIEEAGAHVVLLDLSLPDSQGTATVNAVCGRFPKLPVVVMTGTDDEALGLEELKHGAQDYLVKGQFGHRELKRTISYAIERKELLNEKEDLILKLQEALHRVKRLTGLLPTCADCRKVRTPKGDWVQMESYISEHSEALFTHGFCDNCYEKRLKEIH